MQPVAVAVASPPPFSNRWDGKKAGNGAHCFVDKGAEKGGWF